MARIRLINPGNLEGPRVSWIIIPIVMEDIVQAYFVVMESREFIDYYDEFAIRIAFLTLQGVYEQIMIAENMGNIGFENFIHLALDYTEKDAKKLFYQANIQGISVNTAYQYIVFHQCNEAVSYTHLDVYKRQQANSTNYATYKFWYDQGASRVVSARELSLEEIKDIRAHIPDDMEIESFIHGAMCISQSGRCLLSNYFTGRNANSGECTHPCRWKYSVMEQTRPGEYMPVYENERGTYIFNSKDLNMIEYIDQILDAGIDSLKIEGRMKTALYVATVARTYRKAIDDCKESVEKYRANMDYYKEEIAKCTYRQFTTGFYFGKTDETSQIYDSNTYIKNCTYIGIVQGHNDKGYALLEQKNKFSDVYKRQM